MTRLLNSCLQEKDVTFKFRLRVFLRIIVTPVTVNGKGSFEGRVKVGRRKRRRMISDRS